MKIPGLPPELLDLLGRLHRQGIPVTPLEVSRLRHLLGVEGAVCPPDLEALLSVLLCKDERHRTLLAWEYARWETAQDGALDLAAGLPADGPETGEGETVSRTDGGSDPPTPETARTDAWTDGLRRSTWTRLRRHPRKAAATVALLMLLIAVWVLMPPPLELPQPPGGGASSGGSAPAGPICPQDLPTDPVAQVWAWVPLPDYRPWLAAGGGLLLLLTVLGAARRLVRAEQRYLRGQGGADAGSNAPGRPLPPMRAHGDLLLDPAARREMVWSIDRYLSEDPSRELDPEATVAATARAAGEPRILRRHLSFPREVWLWCDRKTARPALQDRLVAEVRRALDQANLPVRVARFNGLPDPLVWEDSREPFAPGCSEGAGAQAAVVLVSDGAALVRAWESPGERPGLERLLRGLRAWPRLCLVDLGEDGDLTRLCAGWRLEARGAEGLATWLAGRPANLGGPRSPDPAQLDLWAAAWLLANPAEDQVAAQGLCGAMGLRLHPLDHPAPAGPPARLRGGPGAGGPPGVPPRLQSAPGRPRYPAGRWPLRPRPGLLGGEVPGRHRVAAQGRRRKPCTSGDRSRPAAPLARPEDRRRGPHPARPRP